MICKLSRDIIGNQISDLKKITLVSWQEMNTFNDFLDIGKICLASVLKLLVQV